ncbi:XF1762 family protein [Streptomyces sp. NBC_01217]|uniref:XF1762 family protein n=1 Tax=Streptomyces sp. NBC_01217 TaxID=2903779 RepID=UPI002E120EE9|nr:hypothetical protein OG507_32035 [Streptomyces sp. NBC_01217]
MSDVRLHLVPVRSREAKDFVRDWHRHHPPPVGQIFAVGAADETGTLRAVVIVGRPVARHLDDRQLQRSSTGGSRVQPPLARRTRHGLAQALRAHLFGLPTDATPLPTALDALLPATHTATSPEQQTAVLRQLAEQLRNATEIIQRYQYRAQWDRLADSVAEQLRDAHDQAHQIPQALDRVAPAFSSRPTTDTTPGPQPDHGRSATAPATTPTPPAVRHR